KAFEISADPARNFSAASVRESRQFRKAANGHDAGYHRHRDTHFLALRDEVEIAVGIIEILRDRRICAGVDLAFKTVENVFGASRLRMIFRIRGDLDKKVISEFPADKSYQFVGVMEV